MSMHGLGHDLPAFPEAMQVLAISEICFLVGPMPMTARTLVTLGSQDY